MNCISYSHISVVIVNRLSLFQMNNSIFCTFQSHNSDILKKRIGKKIFFWKFCPFHMIRNKKFDEFSKLRTFMRNSVLQTISKSHVEKRFFWWKWLFFQLWSQNFWKFPYGTKNIFQPKMSLGLKHFKNIKFHYTTNRSDFNIVKLSSIHYNFFNQSWILKLISYTIFFESTNMVKFVWCRLCIS